MASPTATGSALAQLAAIYRRELTPQVYSLYGATLSDVDDSTLQIAVERCLRTCKFFPTPAELRDAVGANAEPTVDTEAVVDAIRSMGTYSPATGTTYPTGAKVREVFGHGIAAAYIDAGCAKIFCDNEQGREIAQREFRQNLKAARYGPRGQELTRECAQGLAKASKISARLSAVRFGLAAPALAAGEAVPHVLLLTAGGGGLQLRADESTKYPVVRTSRSPWPSRVRPRNPRGRDGS